MHSIENGGISPSDEEVLSNLGFLVPDAEEEKETMLHALDDLNMNAKRFSGMVVLNLDCNLSCVYCYEGGMKGRHYLSEETADLLVDRIERNCMDVGMPVHLDFYGGEPLLSLKMIKGISARLSSSAEKKGLAYDFSLVTNGTLLTKKRVKDLLPLGLKSAKVTLDGPGQIHDSMRPFKSGLGSYSAILRNVVEVCGIVDVQISGNFIRENYGEFPRLLDDLIEKGVSPDKLSLVKFSPVGRTKGEFALPDFSEGCESINEPWLPGASIFLREELLKRGFRTSVTRPSICVVESAGNLVFNYDGGIYKCPALLGRKGFQIGSLRSGITGYASSHKLGLWKNEECLDCAYLPLCFGGCRYMKLISAGNMDSVDCRKPYLDAALEALVKQDIKYGLKADRG